MSPKIDDSLSLFAPGSPDNRKTDGYPYSLAIEMLERSGGQGFPDDEVSIFAHIVEHEIEVYERRGLLAGPLTVRIENDQVLDLSVATAPFLLPSWVEHDGFDFVSCEAVGVLLIENHRVFEALFNLEPWQSNRLLLATGSGMPRAAMRRVLHRLQERFGLPVFVLADNDTWGYFLFSMLCRGALAPDCTLPFLAVRDVRYVALRAASDRSSKKLACCERPWEDHWDVRLKHLRQYECFQSEHWQIELNAFAKQRLARDLGVLSDVFGAEHIVEIVDSAIAEKTWLAPPAQRHFEASGSFGTPGGKKET